MSKLLRLAGRCLFLLWLLFIFAKPLLAASLQPEILQARASGVARDLLELQRNRGLSETQLLAQTMDAAKSREGNGELEDAAVLYLSALLIAERSPKVLHNYLVESQLMLGSLYWKLGHQKLGVDYMERCLLADPSFAVLNESMHPTFVEDLATLFLKVEDYKKALSYFKMSLELHSKTFGENSPELLKTMDGLVDVYVELGANSLAMKYADQGMRIRVMTYGPVHKLTAVGLLQQSKVFGAMRESNKAMSLQREAVAMISAQLGSMPQKIASQLSTLDAQIGGDKPSTIAALLKQIQEIEVETGSVSPDLGLPLMSLALETAADGRNSEALTHAYRAFAISLSDPNQDIFQRFSMFLAMAAVEKLAGDPDVSALYGKLGINLIQGARTQLSALPSDLQKTFIKKYEFGYRVLIAILVDSGRISEAQQVLSMLKEEEYFNFISRDANASANMSSVQMGPQELKLHKAISEVEASIRELVKDRVVKVDSSKAKGRASVAEAAEIERKIRKQERNLNELVHSLAGSNRNGTDKGNLTDPTAQRINELGGIQESLKELGHDAVLVQYVLTEDGIIVFLIGPKTVLTRVVKLPMFDFRVKVNTFASVKLSDPKEDPLPLAKDLYKVLIAPIEGDLKRLGARTIMLSLDDVLRYVPFAALHDGEKYLIERYAFSMYTEVAKSNLQVLPRGTWRVAGMGVTQSATVRDKVLKSLPAVRQELSSIVRSNSGHADEIGVLSGEVYLDKTFTKSQFRSALSLPFEVLHVASHFVFQPGAESESFLLLGDGADLSLEKLRKENWNFSSMDLVTLSACDTGKGGGQDRDGKEVEGLGTLIQKQGAKGILASLWSVSDRSTAILMQSFYRIRQEQKSTKSDALRAAQISMIKGTNSKPSGNWISKIFQPDTDFSHPYYWAPFVLMGNWL